MLPVVIPKEAVFLFFGIVKAFMLVFCKRTRQAIKSCWKVNMTALEYIILVAGLSSSGA
jgi:hypothetical protein